MAGALLELFIQGPDILGFASTLTRENPYVDIAPGGTALDGPARARKLGNLRVHLVDLCPQGDVGYITFKAASSVDKAAQDEGGSWRPLGRRRQYF